MAAIVCSSGTWPTWYRVPPASISLPSLRVLIHIQHVNAQVRHAGGDCFIERDLCQLSGV